MTPYRSKLHPCDTIARWLHRLRKGCRYLRILLRPWMRCPPTLSFRSYLERHTPRLHYGAGWEGVGGALIKIQRLVTQFPHTDRNWNLLYSVDGFFVSPFTLTRARLLRVPLVLNADGVCYQAWYGPAWERGNQRRKQMLPRADYIFFQSNFAEFSYRKFVGAPQCDSEVLYNAVDTELFRPPSQNQPRPLTLLCAGNHFMRHRLEYALLALACVRSTSRDARLIIAGPLQSRGKGMFDVAAPIKKRIRFLGLAECVEFVPRYTQQEAPAIYNRADIYVHLQINDVCPNSVLEAMACGLPIVFSASGGTPELVGDT